MCRLSWNLGATWNPQGLSKPVMGFLYLLQSQCPRLLGLHRPWIWSLHDLPKRRKSFDTAVYPRRLKYASQAPWRRCIKSVVGPPLVPVLIRSSPYYFIRSSLSVFLWQFPYTCFTFFTGQFFFNISDLSHPCYMHSLSRRPWFLDMQAVESKKIYEAFHVVLSTMPLSYSPS